jgi:NAD(P)-dependent dehydrogenase (short-subunit alcohol dehydrogenase family)
MTTVSGTTGDAFDLSGRVAVVTGGGRGIGLAIGETLAQAGADVVIAELKAEDGDRAAAALRTAGRSALAIEADVRDPGRVDEMVEQVVARYGRVDILVNNAGIARNTPAEATSNEEWREILDVNLNGVFWCCRAVGARMLARGSGTIVNVASMSGSIVNRPQPQAAYNVSKAAVVMLTKSLAAEWAGRGVRVNSVSPGYIDTEMNRRGAITPAWRSTWLEMTPMGRLGQPVEIARAVWFLASDASAFATGTDLIVDGGYTAW